MAAYRLVAQECDLDIDLSQGALMNTPSWKYISTSEVCQLQGRGRTWLWKQIKEGKFPPPDRFGATVRFRSDVVAAAMEAQSAMAAENRAQSEEAAKKLSELGVKKRRANRLGTEQVAQQGGAQ